MHTRSIDKGDKVEIVKITEKDTIFPQQFKNSNKYPSELYCIGDLNLLQSLCVATVGSRKCTAYGRSVARKTAKILAENGITVVSGLARGIDMECHRAVLDAGGKTIAVLGCGIDLCYPRENNKLKEEICEQGLVISEYPKGYKAMPYTFPARNRIIAGISASTVVIEAGYKSGALITAEMAIDAGRLVYAVPGNITSPSSMGTNKLLQDGAMPMVVPEDLLFDLNRPPKPKDSIISKMGEDEKNIYDTLSSHGEMTFDEIKNYTNIPVVKLTGIITVLEMKGIIISSMGKLFISEF